LILKSTSGTREKTCYNKIVLYFVNILTIFYTFVITKALSVMLAKNLQYLRKKTNHSQQELADRLEIPRTTWSGYELGKVEPNITMLQKISAFFKQPVDRLLSQRIDFDDLEVAKSGNLRVLAITMDQDQRQNIELVSSKAEAGYLDSFQDPEYIRELPKMYIPNLPTGPIALLKFAGTLCFQCLQAPS
jgi:transcriptional regulator with XRE-family HTH domain